MTPTPPLDARENDWIPWTGGECPRAVMVQLRFRDGEECGPTRPMLWMWKHFGNASDIIAYWIIQP